MNKSPSCGTEWFHLLWIVYFNFEWESSSSLDMLNVLRLQNFWSTIFQSTLLFVSYVASATRFR